MTPKDLLLLDSRRAVPSALAGAPMRYPSGGKLQAQVLDPHKHFEKCQQQSVGKLEQTSPTALMRQDNRREWRVREDDLADYLERAYKETQERIKAGNIEVPTGQDDD